MGEWLLAIILVVSGGAWTYYLGLCRGRWEGPPTECHRKHKDEL